MTNHTNESRFSVCFPTKARPSTAISMARAGPFNFNKPSTNSCEKHPRQMRKYQQMAKQPTMVTVMFIFFKFCYGKINMFCPTSCGQCCFLIAWCPWICNYPNVFFGDYHWNAKRPEVHGLPFNHNLKTYSTATKAYQFCITQVFCLLGVNVSTAIIVEQWEPQVWTCSTCLEAFTGSDTNVNRYNIVEMYNKHIVETRKPGTVYRCTFWLSVKPFKFTVPTRTPVVGSSW